MKDEKNGYLLSGKRVVVRVVATLKVAILKNFLFVWSQKLYSVGMCVRVLEMTFSSFISQISGEISIFGTFGGEMFNLTYVLR